MINTILIVMLLNGCAAVTTVKKYWPRDHDPALASAYVSTKIGTESISCKDKTTWTATEQQARWLNEYATFRDDSQVESTRAIVENLDKAKNTQSEKACEIWLDLVKQRIIVLNKAWSGR
jgi:hypothetical protein